MLVSITTWPKKTYFGFGPTYHNVTIRVRFAAHEYDALLNIRDFTILEREASAHYRDIRDDEDSYRFRNFDLTLYTLITKRSDTHAFETPMEAQLYVHKLREAFGIFKEYLERNMTSPTASITLEFE